MESKNDKPLILKGNATISLEIPSEEGGQGKNQTNGTSRPQDANETVLLQDVNDTVLLHDANETVLLDELFQSQQPVRPSRELYQLREGEMLYGRYVIGDILGFGGFGITYSAWDTTLEKKVAVKEYYPSNLVNRVPGQKQVEIYSKKQQNEFAKGLSRFLGEARNMAKFSNEKNIVSISNYFEENGTAYLVMEYLDGVSLKEYTLLHGEKLPYKQVIEFTKCIINALKVLHSKNVLHRDISPDNIFICKNGSVKLIDFGAARFKSETDEAKTMSIVLKPGFAPPEQYRSKGKQGPWTDIYALGATMYRTVTGVVPDESVNRDVKDELKEPKEYVPEIPDYFNKILMKCLALDINFRFQNVEELEKKLDHKIIVRSVEAEIRIRKIVRGLLIAAAVLVLGVFGYSEYQYIRRIQNKANLVPGTIQVWIPVDEDTDAERESASFESGIEDFKDTYPDVNIKTEYISSTEYAERLRKAIKNGSAPTVFESSYLDAGDEMQLANLQDTYDMIDWSSGKLKKSIESCYEVKQLPTGFQIPIIYHNTQLEEEGAVYTVHNDKQAFLDGKSPVYVGTLLDYDDIQSKLAGLYRVEGSGNAGQTLEFTGIWGVNASAGVDERNAGTRLLYYMMSEKAQDVWYVQNDNGFPLQKESLQTYAEVNPEFEFTKDYDLANAVYGNIDDNYLEQVYQEIKK